MDQQGLNINTAFQPVPHKTINMTMKQLEAGHKDPFTHEKEEHLIFGLRRDMNCTEFSYEIDSAAPIQMKL